MNQLWKYFKCQQCGKCCEQLGLPLPDPRENDFKKMKDFLQISEEDIISQYYGEIFYKNGKKMFRSNNEKRRPCQFLTENKKCRIYSVRPNPCRKYPLDTDGGRGNVDCPAMNTIDNLPDDAFEE